MKTKEVVDYIVDWLNARCDEAGLKGFVVGVSGGVDSAATSTLCARTGLKTIVVSMPIHQAVSQQSLSDIHIQWLQDNFENVEVCQVELTKPFDVIQESLPQDTHGDLVMANARARLRMLTLYSIAASHSLLVAGTGNKVEDFGVGFFTKYGDGGVDLSPIADLYKSEVREITREMGVREELVNAIPTDGLWHDGRSDEDQLGATYDELEWAMAFEEADGLEEGLEQRQRQVLEIYRNYHSRNYHKMIPIPVAGIPQELR